MHVLRLAKLNENMVEAVIGEWLVCVAAPLKIGQPYVSVITDKGVHELESDGEGQLDRQVGPPGTKVRVGDVLAVLATEHAEVTPTIGELNAPVTVKVSISPKALRLAEENHVDIVAVCNKVKGVIMEKHIRAFIDGTL